MGSKLRIWSRSRRNRRRALAGIVSAAILFAMIFSTGTAYFMYINSQNAAYTQALVNRSNSLTSKMNEAFTVTPTESDGGTLEFTVQNTGQVPLTLATVFLMDNNGNVLEVYNDGSASPNTTPALPLSLSSGVTSSEINTGFSYVSPNTYYIKVVTQRGNTQTVTYPPVVPNYVLQAEASGSLTVNIATFKWLNVTNAASVAQSAYTNNCDSTSCSEGFGNGYNSQVNSQDVLVYAASWLNQNPPATVPTDSLGTTFTLGVSNSVTSTAPESIVQTGYPGTCSYSSGSHTSTCKVQLTNPANLGDILVVGTSSNAAISTIADSQGTSFTQGPSKASGTSYYSNIYYGEVKGTASSETVTVTLSGNYEAQISVYEINGAGLSNIVTPSGGGSTGSSSTPTVASFSPASDSIVIADVASQSATDTAGSGYTLASSTCHSTASVGCAESQLTSSSTTAPFTLGASEPWAETAISFGPATYYSYIWYGVAPSSGTDTITATFSSTVVAAVSVYDLNGAGASAIATAKGSSQGGSASLSTSTSLTPGVSQIVIGNAMMGSTVPDWTAGSGSGYQYQLVAGQNGCNSGMGCSEYDTGLTSSTNVPMTISSSEPWVETAITFGLGPQEQQTGGLVNGFPAVSVPSSCTWNQWNCESSPIIFQITFTNADPQGRDVTLWPQSSLDIMTVESSGFGWWSQSITSFYMVQGPNSETYPTGVVPYSNAESNFVTLPVGVPVTLYFAATQPDGSNINSIKNFLWFDSRNGPFQALFTLTGQYSDGSLFGQTIPFPSGVVTGSHADLSTYSGVTNTVIGVTGENFQTSVTGEIGWLGANGSIASIGSFTTNSNGDISSSFTVPSAPPGYYTVVVTDYANTEFLVFYHD
jgi:hypothetical protein